MKPLSVIFIPVSSPSGIGEYMRSMIIANALKTRFPTLSIHFVLNVNVSYLKSCPYTVHTCEGSATKNVAVVNKIIEKVSPDLVIFDASGRAKQFKTAKRVGAKVAFISQHNKKRNRGLKLNRINQTDVHWVVQPEYCMKELSYWQRTKLAFYKKEQPRNIGPVFESSSSQYQESLLKKYDLLKEEYFIFNAGSGGHLIDGELAADIFYSAALEFNQTSQKKCIVIFGSNYPKPLPEKSKLTCLKDIANKEFVALLGNAQGCVVSAGDTLLQCIALHKPCVSAPVSPDQPARLKQCQAEQLLLVAKASVKSITAQTLKLIPEQKHSQSVDLIITNMKKQAPSKALDIILSDIESLLSVNIEKPQFRDKGLGVKS